MFWESEDYFWNGEAYWFDDSLNWVVYKSHEGTITFGGEWLINHVKDIWEDWSNYTKWDSKKHSRG